MFKSVYSIAILTILISFGASNQARGQCLTASFGQWPGATFTPSCTGTQTITSCGFGSEFSKVNVTIGEIYEFTSSVGTDYITISDDLGITALTWGTSPVAWEATFSGSVRFYTHLNSSCPTTSGGCRTKRVLCPATLPQLDIVPPLGSLIDFGSANVGDQLTETLSAENVGSANLDLACNLTDDAGGVFSLLPSDPFLITLTPADSPVDFDIQCTIPTLAAGTTQTYTGEMSCTANAPALPGPNTFALICQGDAVSAVAIPSLGRYGLLALILGLMMMAIPWLRASRRF